MDTQPRESSAEKVGPQPTVGLNSPYLRSKKAEYIHIGGKLVYEYPTSAVMASARGDKEQSSTARELGSFNATPVESQNFRGSHVQ
jgi:hypothetical protein